MLCLCYWVCLLVWCLQMEYSLHIPCFAKTEVSWSCDPWHNTWHRFLFSPRSRNLQRREEKARPRRWGWWGWWWRRRRVRARLKARAYRVTLLPNEPERPPSYNPHRLCNPRLPPQLWALFLGQDCTGWVGQVELPSPFFFSLPPMELRATQHFPPHPPHGPEVLRQPSTQHSTISLSIPLYVFPCEDFGTGI